MPNIDFKKVSKFSKLLAVKFLKFVNPMPDVGGLEVSDIALRYIRLQNNKIMSVSLRLPPGIIESGVVKDETNFILALKELHGKIAGADKNKKIYTIVSLPSEIVYSQVFDIPLLKGVSLESAVELNLEMISPLKRGEAYSDSQQVGTREDGGFQLEYLGAFVEAEKVDRMEKFFLEAGFISVAAEFAALALTRVIKELGQGFDFSRSYVVLNVLSAGINFLIIRNGNLYFHYFIPWRQIQTEDRRISMGALRELIQHHLQQVLNFHTTRWGVRITDLILIAPGLNDALKKIISENFKIDIINLSLKEYPGLAPEYFIALGLALRGAMPRGKDVFISLLPVSTEKEFQLNQIMNFMKFWRDIIAIVFVFLLLIFGTVDALIASAQRSVQSQNQRIAVTADVGKLEKLQTAATEFNTLLELAKNTKQEEYAWTVFLARINGIASKNGITLNRIFFQSFDVPILLNGSAQNEEAIIAFKNDLAKEPNFQNVGLPLTSLSSTSSGVSFGLNFKLIK